MELVELDVAALTAHWAKLLQSRGIRGTSDPTRFAVVDVIKDATGLCKPENAWDALKRRRDDLVARCTVWQFRGGPGTAVAAPDVLADIMNALRNPEARKFCRRFAAPDATTREDERPAAPTYDFREATGLAESLMSEDVASGLPSDDEVKDITTQLSQVLGRSVDIRIRKTPAGQVALIDLAMILTGMNNDNAGNAVRNFLKSSSEEFRLSIPKFKFPGRGQRTVGVANLATALEFAFLLPGRAARVRCQAVTLIARYLGGGTRLIDEVFQNRRVQEALAAGPAEALTPDEQAQAATHLEDARPAIPEEESDASEEDRDAQPASDTQEAEDLAESLMSEDVASELHSEDEVTDIETQLSQVFGRSVDIHIRKTPEGLVAIIDIAMIFTGMENNNAARAVRNLIREHTELNHRLIKFKFPGRGQRMVDVANLATALEFAFLLPGRAAARVRRQAATLLVRYLGGDTRLIDEVCQNRRVQEALAAAPAEALTPDEQAVRLCGEAVEAHAEAAPSTEGSVFVPCNPCIIRDEHAVGLPGSDHLYAARRRGEDCDLMKIGISNDVLQRVSSLAQTFGAPYELLAVWPHEAVLESQVFELLKPAKASLGTSREHFSASFEQICQIVVAARNLYRMNAELEALGTKRKRQDESELQEELADRALRRRRAEVQIKREELQLKHDDLDRCLLHDLVKQGDDEARRTFLATLTASC